MQTTTQPVQSSSHNKPKMFITGTPEGLPSELYVAVLSSTGIGTLPGFIHFTQYLPPHLKYAQISWGHYLEITKKRVA